VLDVLQREEGADVNEIKIVKPYPLHKVPGEPDPKTGKPGASTFHQLLMLPEQIGLRATDVEHVQLFCVHCKSLVIATVAQYKQAQEAAIAEGVGGIVIGPPVPGSLPEDVRIALFHTQRLPRYLADLERLKANPWRAPKSVVTDVTRDVEAIVKKSTAAILRGTIDGVGLGFFVEFASPVLTPAGESMAAQVADPEVPQMLPEDPEAFARYAAALIAEDKKDRRKSRAKSAIDVPMVCVCGHGPREHLDAAGADVPCKVPGVECPRYRQAKPPKPEKKSKAPAVVTS
jgi:hypothetical protein